MLMCKHCFRINVEKYLKDSALNGAYWDKKMVEKQTCLCYNPIQDTVDVNELLDYWLGTDRDRNSVHEHINTFISVVECFNSIYSYEELQVIFKMYWFDTWEELDSITPIENTFNRLVETYNKFIK